MIKSVSHYWWIYIIFIIVFGIMFTLSQTIWKDYSWISNTMNVIGTFASLAGVVLALVQIKQTNTQIDLVSATTEATKKAVLENKDEIKRFLSYSEMGHLVEIIKNTQNYIIRNDYGTAVVLMQGIKDDLLRADIEYKNILDDHKLDITVLIKTLNSDIKSLVDFLMQAKKEKCVSVSLRPDVIHSNLESAREEVIKIESIIKTKTL